MSGSARSVICARERSHGAHVCFDVETSQHFREFAAECDRLAQEAMTEEHRTILRRMAVAWLNLAEEYDRDHFLSRAC